jgi:iron complex transport system substrate-binding protein
VLKGLAVAALLAAIAVPVVAARSVTPAAAPLPTRIVSLSPTATEMLFAIGAGKQVVAVDDQSDYPKTAPRTKLSGFTPNAEAVARYRPDLVVVTYDTNTIVAALGKLHVKVLFQPAVRTLAGTYAQIGALGRVTGHVAGAKAVVARMRARLAALVASVPRPSHPLTYYHELSPDFYSATSATFIGRIYALFGLTNIADKADSSGTGYPKLSAEYIVQSDPDLVVLADGVCCAQTPATLGARPGWGGMRAVRRHAIVQIDDSIASRWGPRVVDFARAVASALRTTES